MHIYSYGTKIPPSVLSDRLAAYVHYFTLHGAYPLLPWVTMPLLGLRFAAARASRRALWRWLWVGVSAVVVGLCADRYGDAYQGGLRAHLDVTWQPTSLPFLLLWLVWRVGYDRRGLWAWCVTAWALIVVCYVWMPPPPEPGADVDPNLPVNINYVFGLDGRQTWMPAPAWLVVWMLAQPTVLAGPTHLALRRLAPTAPRR